MHLWGYLFLCFCFVSAKKETVKVSVYYESFCPFSIEFITKQLYPGYVRLEDSVILDLVPYGKANKSFIDGNWAFTCQHGPKECIGNKLQACVLSKRYQRSNKMGFVDCIMNSTDPSSTENGKQCAQDNHINWPSIAICMKTSEGDRILAHYGDRSNALTPKLTYVPHIIFNGIFNQTLENSARDDFFQTVCGLFVSPPTVCDD